MKSCSDLGKKKPFKYNNDGYAKFDHQHDLSVQYDIL